MFDTVSPNSTRNFKSELAAEKPMRSLARSSVIKYDKTIRALFDSTWHACQACNGCPKRNTRVPRKIGGTDKQKKPLPGKSYVSNHQSVEVPNKRT